MFRLVALFALVLSSVANAQTVEVPLRADGSVDLDAVYPTFKATTHSTEKGRLPEYIGSFLEQSFTAAYDNTDITKPFDLTIKSTNLSEHAYFMLAALLNGIICLEPNLPPGELLWQETAVPLGDGWKVKLSCAKAD